MASRLISRYLIDRSPDAVRPEEIAADVYGEIVGDGRKTLEAASTIVATILGPKLQGKRIARILDAEGFVLQYGWRRQEKELPDGGRQVFGPKLRLYRAVPITIESIDVDTSPDFVFEERVVASWQT